MNEFDHLERQLRESVSDLSPGPRRRRRLRLFAIAVPVVAIAGAASAATLIDHPTANRRANVVVRDVVRETASDPACARFIADRRSPDFSDAKPLPEITRILPTLNRPPAQPVSASDLRRAQQTPLGAAIIRDTVRVARFPDGTKVLLMVIAGRTTGLSVTDPQMCKETRLDALADENDLDDTVRARAREVLNVRPDTDPQAQMLITSAGGGSGAQQIEPGHPISTRRDFSVSGAFSGIAHPRATTVTVQRLRPGARRSVWRGEGAYSATIPVQYGLYGFKGRGGTSGRYRVVQYDSAGQVVRRAVLPK